MTEDDNTIVRGVRRALQRERFPDDRRAPPPVNWLAWLPLMLAVVAGLSGYFDTQNKASNNAEAIKDLKEWNKSISERVRVLELR